MCLQFCNIYRSSRSSCGTLKFLMIQKLKEDEGFMVLVLFWDEYWTLRRRQNSKCWSGVKQIQKSVIVNSIIML